MEANWSSMTTDILDQIIDKISTVEDLMNFSIVCHSWYAAYKHAKSGWSPQMPWLMLVESTKENYCKFFDPSISKYYHLRVPKTFMSWGSAYGWIATIDLDFEIYVFNPFNRAHAKLPSARSLPGYYPTLHLDPSGPKRIKEICGYLLDRIVLLEVPQWDGKLLAVSISGDLLNISISRANDLKWKPIIVGNGMRNRGFHYVMDVAYHNGALFIIYLEGEILRVKLDNDAMDERFLIASPYSPPPGEDLVERRFHRFYLTESSGNLIVIMRIGKFIGDALDQFGAKYVIFKTQAFAVYKVNNETKAWESMKDIGEESIFVGSNTATHIQRCNVRCNCIYFTEDIPKKHGTHSVGVCSFGDDLDKGGFSTIYQGDDSHACSCSQFLFVPKV